jgi:hypothetical protein
MVPVTAAQAIVGRAIADPAKMEQTRTVTGSPATKRASSRVTVKPVTVKRATVIPTTIQIMASPERSRRSPF